MVSEGCIYRNHSAIILICKEKKKKKAFITAYLLFILYVKKYSSREINIEKINISFHSVVAHMNNAESPILTIKKYIICKFNFILSLDIVK